MKENYLFKKNIINLEYEDFEKTPVYRIFRLEDALELFNSKEITLVKAKLWEDPYENFIFKCNAKYNNNPINISSLQEQVFGQCWSLLPESDAMWRIYSTEHTGIKIKSNLEKIFDVIFDKSKITSQASSYIGSVDYKSLEEIKKYFSNPSNTNLLGIQGPNLIKSLLLKREEFEHEKEVRLLYFVDSESIKKENNIIKFEVNPNDLVEEICFDPRISERYFKLYKQTFRKLGYNGQIIKSNLYDFEGIDIEIKN